MPIATSGGDGPRSPARRHVDHGTACTMLDHDEATVKGACVRACDTGLDHSSWTTDSIQKFRPAGRVNVKNAETATGSAGTPSTT
jgi:hypothetical protein